jgi:hypothetical protein
MTQAIPGLPEAEKNWLTNRLTEFVNSWPLYSPFRLDYLRDRPGRVELPPTILRDCRRCGATPTWAQQHPIDAYGANTKRAELGCGFVTRYVCTHCGKEQLRLWLYIEDHPVKEPDDTIRGYSGAILRKLGQWPAQEIEPSKELEKGLPEASVPLYKKGLTTLAHGFGLGALGYFRRVVEDASTHLIDLFADRAEADGDSAAADELRKAKLTHRMEDRLKAAADALPLALRPGGVNPLAALYGQYSRGLHGLSDEECLVVAHNLQFALDYIFRTWKAQMAEAERFQMEIGRWSDPSTAPEASRNG